MKVIGFFGQLLFGLCQRLLQLRSPFRSRLKRSYAMSQLILQVNEFFLGLQLVFVKKALIGIQTSIDLFQCLWVVLHGAQGILDVPAPIGEFLSDQ